MLRKSIMRPGLVLVLVLSIFATGLIAQENDVQRGASAGGAGRRRRAAPA